MVNFEQEVLMRSQEVPVVVDFWAPWCGPCQTLGPIIEELAKEAAGKWELVKVNSDEQQEVSAQYKIRSIPAVKMFYMGEVKAEFTGALPKHQVQQWLKEHLPDEFGDQLSVYVDMLFTEQHEKAVQNLEGFLELNPEHIEAQLWLAAATVGTHPERAEISLPESHQFHTLSGYVKDIADLMKCNEKSGEKMQLYIANARQALKNYQYELLIQELISATLLDKNYCNELPRRAAVALFLMLGTQHEITKKYRRQFDMALY